MRVLLTLEHRPGAVLPTDYRAAIAAWIYKTIGASDAAFSEWLHQEGYPLGHRKFKLLTFGLLRPKRYEVKGGTFYLSEGPSELIVSFFLPEAAQHLVLGLFNDLRFYWGSSQRQEWFTVREARVLPVPTWSETMEYRMISPCCIAQPVPDGGPSNYLHPSHSEFGERLVQNLQNKWLALPEHLRPALPENYNWAFSWREPVRDKLHRIHEQQVKGYVFDFQLTVPIPLQQIAYWGGFGEKGGSLGYGFAELPA